MGVSDISILNDKKRMFKAILTAEVRDKDGDLIPIDEVVKVMPDYLSEGGALLYRHLGRPIGKVLNFMPKEFGGKPAIEIIGLVGNSFPYHDEVWDAIKRGELKGVSFHGDAIKDQNGNIQVISGVEVSLTPNPANPMALVQEVSVLAKESDNMEIEKKDNCKAKYTNPDNSFKGGFDGCVSYMKDCRGLSEESANKLCAYIGRKTGKIKEADYIPIMDYLREVDSMKKEIKKQDEPAPQPDNSKNDLEKKVDALAEAVSQLNERVTELAGKIEAKPQETEQVEAEAKPPVEEKKPEEEVKPEVKKEAIAEIVKEQVNKLINEKFEKVKINTEKPASNKLNNKQEIVKIGKKVYSKEKLEEMYN